MNNTPSSPCAASRCCVPTSCCCTPINPCCDTVYDLLCAYLLDLCRTGCGLSSGREQCINICRTGCRPLCPPPPPPEPAPTCRCRRKCR